MSQIRLDRHFFSDALNQATDKLESQALESLDALRSKTCTGKEWTGWFHWPQTHGFKLADDIKVWKSSLDFEYDLIVVIGIGGSYLGTRAISDLASHTFAQAFSRRENAHDAPQIVFAGNNMSESSMADLLDLMEQRTPIVNVISKSGTTTEPGVAFRVIRAWMEKRFGIQDSVKRIIATTDPQKGALKKVANECGYKTFVVPSDLGGRYSVLTAVGLVPVALAGYDIDALLQGAHEVFQEFCAPQPKGIARVGLEYAMCRTAAWNAGKTIEVVAYPEPKMRNLVEWFKQLFGESDGKQGKGLFPASIECTMDLHSMGQYMQDGARTMMETFLSVDNPRASKRRVTVPANAGNVDELKYLEGTGLDEINDNAMLATRIAHADGGVPALELRISDLSARTIGSLFAMYETSCAIGGLMLGINPFDQEGVEAYKVNLFGLLGKPGFEAKGDALKKRMNR